MTRREDAMAERQDGRYTPPVLAPARGGQVPVWNMPATVDNGGNDTATASPSPVTEESG
jgi:hypothetical protein